MTVNKQALPRVKRDKEGVVVLDYERCEVSFNFKVRPINSYRSMDDTNS